MEKWMSRQEEETEVGRLGWGVGVEGDIVSVGRGQGTTGLMVCSCLLPVWMLSLHVHTVCTWM